MLEQTFARLERQVQSAERRVSLLEMLDDAQRVAVVVEARPIAAHFPIQSLFAGMAERRVPQVVGQSQTFHQVFVQSQCGGGRARHLRNLQGVRQTVSKMVGVGGGEDLRLVLQAPECARMNHAVAVALKRPAVGVLALGIAAAAGFLRWKPQLGCH